MADFAPLSTGKKMKARRVFGDAIADDHNCSLSYSPSPLKLETIEEISKSLTTFGEDDKSSTESDSSSISIAHCNEKENLSVPHQNMLKFGPVPSQKSVTQSICHEPRKGNLSSMRPDLVQKTQDAIKRASESIRSMQTSKAATSSINPSLASARQAKLSVIRQKARQTAKYRAEWQEVASDAKSFNHENEKYRIEMLDLQRQLSSKYSKQRATNTKEQKLAHLNKIEKESRFRSSVYREQQEKLREEKERLRRMSTEAKAKVRENHMFGKEIMKLQQIEEDNAIHEERYATSLAIRETMKEKIESRRKSFMFRSEHAKRIREIFHHLETARLEDERKNFELKHAAENDASAYKRWLEEERRKSFAKRNEYGRQQRLRIQEENAKEKANEHAYYELKHAAERDVVAYHKHLDEERRKSLANRNQYASKVRLNEMELAVREREEEHKNFELKRASDKDVEAYKTQLAAERRLSLEKRAEEARRIQQQTKQQESESLASQHSSYELDREAWKDTLDYKRKLEEQRRQSLAWRNEERARHSRVMAEIEALAKEKETESLVLKWAGDSDAKVYLEKLNEERRKSLQLRGLISRQQREVESAMRQEELEQQSKDEELRAADKKEVEKYLKECNERNRRSLVYRAKESRLQRLHNEEILDEKRKEEEEAFQLETQAWVDVQEYIEECKERRRLSLAFRAQEKRRHAAWESKKAEKEREDYSRLVRDRLADQRHVEAARQKERARIALEAIRHFGRCMSSTSNPFSTILE